VQFLVNMAKTSSVPDVNGEYRSLFTEQKLFMKLVDRAYNIPEETN
jgi:hypothetical protein